MRRREIPTPTWVLEQHIPDLADEHPLTDLIRDALEELPEEQRDLLLFYFYERRTLTEIADETGVTHKSSAHYRIDRALDALKKILAEKGLTDDSF
jgi:RNA polymerase sigma factor (sigma-70 family)